MGIIGSIFGAITGMPMASDRALLDTLCLASLADGKTSEVEIGYALEIAMDLPGFRRTNRSELEALLQESQARLHQDENTRASMRRVARQLGCSEMLEQAFALAAVVVYVDSRLQDPERTFLDHFKNELGLEEPRATNILGEIESELSQLAELEERERRGAES